jgi:hypothetical protein
MRGHTIGPGPLPAGTYRPTAEIPRGIVEAHQGRVSVVNTVGGCRFEVRLPANETVPGTGQPGYLAMVRKIRRRAAAYLSWSARCGLAAIGVYLAGGFSVWLAVGHGSCAMAVRVLDGGGREIAGVTP